MKKDEMRFSIRFNSADPRHIKAAQILNLAGRRKATIVADALWEYELKHGAGEVSGNLADSEVFSPGAYSNESFANPNWSHAQMEVNPTLQDSILEAIGQFRDD